MRKVIVETERLKLFAPSSRDFDAFADMWSDGETMKYVGGDGIGWDRERVGRWLDRQIACHQKNGMSYWTVVNKVNDQVLGQGGLEPIVFNGDEIELGYQLGKAHWGMGYATEVAQASVKFGIESLGLERFVALVYPENTASVQVLEKVGFGFVGASDLYYDTMMDVYEIVKA